jgi:hypothetical protein
VRGPRPSRIRGMEHLVRVQNERDRRTLAWLRGQVGDAAIVAARRCVGPSKPYLSAVCRLLGVTVPRFSAARRPMPSATAGQSLATIRQILASRSGRQTPATDALQRRWKTAPRAGAVTNMYTWSVFRHATAKRGKGGAGQKVRRLSLLRHGRSATRAVLFGGVQC